MRLLVLTLLISLSFGSLAQNSVEIVSSKKHYIEKELVFCHDSIIGDNVGKAIKLFTQGDFISYDQLLNSFSGNEYYYWAGIRLINKLHTPRSFTLNFPASEHVKIYLIHHDSLISEHETGTLIPVGKREIGLGVYNSVEILLVNDADYLILTKVSESTVGNNLGILGFWVMERKAFFDKITGERFFLGIFFGVILIMILYNLFVYFSIREKSYLLYVLTILGNGLIWFTNYKLEYEYIFPHLTLESVPWVGLFVSSFFGICFILFTQSFLETKTRNPWWHGLGKGIILLLIIIPFLYFFNINWYIVLYRFSFLLGLITFVSILLVSGVSFYKKFRPARFFFLANIFYAVGFIIIIMGVFNLFDPDSIWAYSMQVGNMIEITFFSLALADRINILKAENEQKQVAMIEQLKENERLKTMVALELETKVKERTVEINQQKEEISAQRDLLQEQNVKLNRFHDHTTESLRYAQSIQAAILPSQRVFEQIAADYFVFIHPCEMVSGDFFWASTIGDYHIFCVADCTGHGVPGAFMSILGISTLNEIVNRHQIVNPAKILDLLRDRVIEALSQNDPENMHKDGLDIALCSFNIKTKELLYAGAGIPMWILSPSSNINLETETLSADIIHKDFSLFEIKGDNMPVGKSPVLKPFSNKQFDISKSDSTSIYLSTDGFADQVSEDDGTKFGSQRLKNLIVSYADREMVNQKDNLSKTFTTWKGQTFQVDDVTVVGLKII